jgi:hypothetical protein
MKGGIKSALWAQLSCDLVARCNNPTQNLSVEVTGLVVC